MARLKRAGRVQISAISLAAPRQAPRKSRALLCRHPPPPPHPPPRARTHARSEPGLQSLVGPAGGAVRLSTACHAHVRGGTVSALCCG
ncbi:hypothetical protein T492DRAFT_1053389 [Pavlovales sp. CCMP2436]|nr:hypothetical protein T492DRAFT_1053389 [Pavlovales sp. CCMP2436]